MFRKCQLECLSYKANKRLTVSTLFSPFLINHPSFTDSDLWRPKNAENLEASRLGWVKNGVVFSTS